MVDRQSILRRYKELEEEAMKNLIFSVGSALLKNPETGREFGVANDVLLNWIMKAQNLIANTCGEDSLYFKKFDNISESLGQESSLQNIRKLIAIFTAAREDFEKGFIFSIKDLVLTEVFGDELDQAAELLQCNHILAAAVVAGVVLEMKIRGLCDRFSIPYSKLEKANADLVKRGAYNVNVQKKITALAGIRNSAAHGKTDEFNRQSVASMIGDVREFVADSNLLMTGSD